MRTAAAALILALILASCDSLGPKTYDIEYRVTGTATDVSLTYENSTGNTEQRDANVPWSYRFEADPGTFLYVSAQNNNNDEGSVTAQILIDGDVEETATSQGAFVIATSSGSTPRE